MGAFFQDLTLEIKVVIGTERINPLKTETPKRIIWQTHSSENIIIYIWKIITRDPSINTMDHPGITVSNFM